MRDFGCPANIPIRQAHKAKITRRASGSSLHADMMRKISAVSLEGFSSVIIGLTYQPSSLIGYTRIISPVSHSDGFLTQFHLTGEFRVFGFYRLPQFARERHQLHIVIELRQ